MAWFIDDISLELGKKTILSQARAPIYEGKLTCLLGPNGAGKSSLFKVMVGEHRATQGKVWFKQQTLSSFRVKELAKQRAVLPQQAVLDMRMTALEVVMLGRMPWKESDQVVLPMAKKIMEMTDCAHLADRMATVLSGGEQMRVNLARCLLQVWSEDGDLSERWLILDEPLAPLDIAHQLAVMQLLKKLVIEHGLSVVMTVHDLTIALQWSDDVVLMSQGRIFTAGQVEQVMSENNIQQVYGVRCQKVIHAGKSWLMFDAIESNATTDSY